MSREQYLRQLQTNPHPLLPLFIQCNLQQAKCFQCIHFQADMRLAADLCIGWVNTNQRNASDSPLWRTVGMLIPAPISSTTGLTTLVNHMERRAVCRSVRCDSQRQSSNIRILSRASSSQYRQKINFYRNSQLSISTSGLTSLAARYPNSMADSIAGNGLNRDIRRFEIHQTRLSGTDHRRYW
jgi:hypothetical protein